MLTHYFTTGDAARLFSRTEPQVADLVRRGKIRPQPQIVAGRRLWTRAHLLQAAEALGILTDDLRFEIEQHGSSALSPRSEEVPSGA